jgi:hypothetical protein
VDFLRTASLLVLGTLDANSRPWTSIIGSALAPSEEGRGFIAGLEDDQLEVSGRVALGDPALSNLQRNGMVMISGLGMDLGRRKRVKLFGSVTEDARSIDENSGKIAMTMKVTQSMGKILLSRSPYPKIIANVL